MGVCLNHTFSNQLPLYAVSEQVTIIPAQAEIEINTQGRPKIIYYQAGGVELSLEDGSQYQICPGDTVILAGDSQQRYRVLGSEPAVQLHAQLFFFETRRSLSSEMDGMRWDRDLEKYLKDSFQRNQHLKSRGCYPIWELANRFRRECESSHPMKHRLLCELARRFALLVAEYAELHSGTAISRKARLVQQACETALRRKVISKDPKVMARSLAVSEATLNRAFNWCVGVSYARYMTVIEVEQAKTLLLDSHYPIARIARLLDFSSPSVFCRAFKAATGLTPKGYQQTYDGTPVFWKSSLHGEHPRKMEARQNFSDLESWEPLNFPALSVTKALTLILCLKGSIRVRVEANAPIVLDEKSSQALLVPKGKRLDSVPFDVESKSFALKLEDQSGCYESENQKRQEKVSIRKMHQLLQKSGGLPLGFSSRDDLDLLHSWATSERRDAHALLMMRSLCRTIWIVSLRSAVAQCGPKPESFQPLPAHQLLVNHARDFIKKHLADKLTLGEIAWGVGVSGEHLSRIFRIETGQTVMDFIQECRIYRSKKLLLKTDKPMTEIAEEVGFSSVPLFYRTFRRREGSTPKGFREKGITPP